MWIFIISIIEFIVINLINQLFNSPSNAEMIAQIDHPLLNFIVDNGDYISYSLSLVFIILFFYRYRNISTTTSTKNLMKQIIKTKQTVNYYIYINIFIFSLIFILTSYFVLQHSITNNAIAHQALLYITAFVVLIISVIIFLVWIYYKLLYGLLIKKLMKNYKELEKIDLD